MPTEAAGPSMYRRQFLPLLRVMFTLVLCAAAGFYLLKSIYWKLMGDPSAMHYVNFLIDQGWAPYRDILDMNLPGAYFMEGWAMHVFGGGDLGWRFYDFSLLAILIASLITISLPYDWFAGLFAGVTFLLIHGAEGPWNAGQRELVMITLIMVSYAFLFTALRRQKPLLALPFGFFIGLAASLKPTAAPLGLVLLAMTAIILRKNNIRATPFLVNGLLGLVFTLLLNLLFLYQYHAFADFIAISKRLTPYYASIGNSPPLTLLPWLIRIRGALMLVIGAVLIFFNRKQNDWEDWERAALALGILFGASSFVVQGKKFDHHAYSFLVFLFVWFAIEVSKAWKKKGWMQAIGLTVFAVGTLIWVPLLVLRVNSADPEIGRIDTLVSDLTRLGGSSLQREVQCFDIVASCPSAFYRLKLLPYSKPATGDIMFFPPAGNAPMMYYRNIMWNDLQKNPPRIIVVTNEWLCEPFTFDKLRKWPEFVSFLNSAYSLTVSRSFKGGQAYRIYVLKSAQSSIARAE